MKIYGKCSKRKVLLKQVLMISTILFMALANLVCLLEKPTEASFILDWINGSTKSSSNNNEEDDDFVPNFDGWPNSLNSNFLKPGTYTLSTDSSQESLEENKVNNMNKVYYDDNCDNELNFGNIKVEY